MAEAFICDRCGEFGISPDKRLWKLAGDIGKPPLPHAKESDWYLCSECVDGLDEFMNGER